MFHLSGLRALIEQYYRFVPLFYISILGPQVIVLEQTSARNPEACFICPGYMP